MEDIPNISNDSVLLQELEKIDSGPDGRMGENTVEREHGLRRLLEKALKLNNLDFAVKVFDKRVSMGTQSFMGERIVNKALEIGNIDMAIYTAQKLNPIASDSFNIAWTKISLVLKENDKEKLFSSIEAIERPAIDESTYARCIAYSEAGKSGISEAFELAIKNAERETRIDFQNNEYQAISRAAIDAKNFDVAVKIMEKFEKDHWLNVEIKRSLKREGYIA